MATFPKFETLPSLYKEFEKNRLKKDLTTFLIKTYGKERPKIAQISSFSSSSSSSSSNCEKSLFSVFPLIDIEDTKNNYTRDKQVLEEIIKDLQCSGYKARRVYGDTLIEFWGTGEVDDSLNSEILKSIRP